ncbi:MAG: DUF952 domain-containing protein [Nakamurella sp.]
MSDGFVYHYTTAADWARSVAAGEHLVSGRGMTLQEQGFIHFCEQLQLAGVWQRFWTAETEPVVLLTVDKGKLPTPIVDENTSGGTELFPHLYAPLPVAAVLDVRPVDADGRPQR